MTHTATTSPRYHSHSSHPRSQQRPSTTTPSCEPSMTPFLSPRRMQPSQLASPNYFACQGDGSSYMSDSSNNHAKANWSPPSSAVRSTAAGSPSAVPLDRNPEYDAFRKQSEGKVFNLGGVSNLNTAMPRSRPGTSRSSSGRNSLPQQSTPRPRTEPKEIPASSHRGALDQIDTSSAQLSRSPKRLLSPGSATESNRRGSPPASLANNSESDRTPTSPEPQQRFRLPLDGVHSSFHKASLKARAETLPASTDSDESQLMVTPQHVVNLLESKDEEILILDLRVATQYATAHISGALNLCIPTTLLKRPSFNVQKLAETFKDDEHRSRFENWRSSSYIIVYDASSAAMKDAAICLHTIKKFRTEGYEGTVYIIRGGLSDFAKRFPSYIDSGLSAIADGDGPEVAPVVGGCPMPATDKPANPFFGNIRQNMDLIGGVGQLPLKHPAAETKFARVEYPDWLKDAANDDDQGKKVSNKFEQIERREKKRMEDALTGRVSFGTPKPSGGGAVQIAGLEKGNKNRYNNIWPFEHSRVKLQGVPSHGCDYFNANHIKASLSHKRYISTQAPIPATFNDFWSVVWQQDVRVIVMLTAEKEGAQVKAHNYWDQKQYGAIRLDFLSEKRASLELSRIHRHQNRPAQAKRSSTMSQHPEIPLAQLDTAEVKSGERPFVIVRKFTLSHSRFPFAPMREITQLQYSSWPDFGAPAHPAHLLGLVEQCNAVVRASDKTRSTEPGPVSTRPILVHCSAGCGRTGTFCTVDSVIDMLKRQHISRNSTGSTPMDVDRPTGREDPFDTQSPDSSEGVEGGWVHRDDQDLVERTVEDFRHQRISMVQSLRQYVLCYESIMEWLANHRQEH